MNAVPNPGLYEPLLALPEHVVGEILQGTLYTQARPAGRRGLVERGLSGNFINPFDFGRGGPGVVDHSRTGSAFRPRCRSGGAGFGRLAARAHAGRSRRPAFRSRPRLDVRNPLARPTAKKDRVVKLPLYARYGVAHVWLGDPAAQILEAFELHEGRRLLIAALKDDDRVAVPPFDAVEFSLADLWG